MKRIIDTNSNIDSNSNIDIDIDTNPNTNINTYTNRKSIFSKNNNSITLKMEELQEAIPSNSYDQPNVEYAKTHTEWRWRFFEIGDRRYVEITYKHPDKSRVYKNNHGEWITCELDDKWNKYVRYSKYYYSNQ